MTRSGPLEPASGTAIPVPQGNLAGDHLGDHPGDRTAPDDSTTDVLRVRRLEPDAPAPIWSALTELLHRAYAGQVAIGLRPLAGRQSPDVTRQRCTSGETFVAEIHGPDNPGCGLQPRLCGMILFQELEEAAFPAWFLRPQVAHFSLFAVEPSLQGRGVGAALLDAAQRRAQELGFSELALSMAEPDTGLREYYHRRGFRFVQHWRWPYTNYRSAILSRPIGEVWRDAAPRATARGGVTPSRRGSRP